MTKYQRTTPFYIDFFAVNFEVIILYILVVLPKSISTIQNLLPMSNIEQKKNTSKTLRNSSISQFESELQE